MERKGDVLYNVLDQYTGENVNYEKTLVWADGTNMSDEKCDGFIYRKKDNEYFKRVLPQGVIDVRWYGAKGDGVTDDTVNIQKAHDSLPEGGTLIIPALHTFIVNGVVFNRMRMKIEGGGTLKGSVRFGFTNDAHFDSLSFFDTQRKIRVKGIEIEGLSNSNPDHKSVILRNIRDVTFDDVRFTRGYYAVFAETRQCTKHQHVARIHLNNCEWINGANGIYYEGATSKVLDGFWEFGDTEVLNSTMKDMRERHIYMERIDGLQMSNVKCYFNQTDVLKKENIFLRACTWVNINSTDLFESGLDAVLIQNPKNITIDNTKIAFPGDNGVEDRIGSGIVIEGADAFGGNLHGIQISSVYIERTVNHAIIFRKIGGQGLAPQSPQVNGLTAIGIGLGSGDSDYATRYRAIDDTGCLGGVYTGIVTPLNRNKDLASPTGSNHCHFEGWDKNYGDKKTPLRLISVSGTSQTFDIDAGCDTYVTFNHSALTSLSSYTSFYKRNGQIITMVAFNNNTVIPNNTFFKTLSGKSTRLETKKIYQFMMWAIDGDYYLYQLQTGSTLLTGYAVGSNDSLSATDDFIAAFGKIQGQLNNKVGLATAGDFNTQQGYKLIRGTSGALNAPYAGATYFQGIQFAADNNNDFFNQLLFDTNEGVGFTRTKINGGTPRPYLPIQQWKVSELTEDLNVVPGNFSQCFFGNTVSAPITLVIQTDPSTRQGVVKEFINDGNSLFKVQASPGVTINGLTTVINLPAKGDRLKIISISSDVWKIIELKQTV